MEIKMNIVIYIYFVVIVFRWISWSIQSRTVYQLQQMWESDSWYDMPRLHPLEDKKKTLKKKLSKEKRKAKRDFRIAIIFTAIGIATFLTYNIPI